MLLDPESRDATIKEYKQDYVNFWQLEKIGLPWSISWASRSPFVRSRELHPISDRCHILAVF